jgi:peroxiredoxin
LKKLATNVFAASTVSSSSSFTCREKESIGFEATCDEQNAIRAYFDFVTSGGKKVK